MKPRQFVVQASACRKRHSHSKTAQRTDGYIENIVGTRTDADKRVSLSLRERVGARGNGRCELVMGTLNLINNHG